MHASKRSKVVTGVADKTPVIAVKSRATKKVKARVTKPVSSINLHKNDRRNIRRRLHRIHRPARGIYGT